jgi:hypothetical protein
MMLFDPSAGHLVITDNRVQTLLTDRTEREMVIKQPAQQLPAVTVKALLQPRVIHASRIGPVHEADQRLELLTASSEPIHRRLAALTAGVAIPSDCTITTTAPERQDFTHRRVKFNSTGVEIGGHVRPPPWSTKDKNNADFDTLFMTPRPRPAPGTTRPTPRRRPQHPDQRARRSGKPLLTASLPRQSNGPASAQNPETSWI